MTLRMTPTRFNLLYMAAAILTAVLLARQFGTIFALGGILAYGIFVFSVSPVGFVITDLSVGVAMKVDNAGRLVKWTSGSDAVGARIAIVESVSADRLVARTLGN